jgi:hypothetical protein
LTVANYKPGDWIVYTKQKVSPAPGKRAQEVTPAAKGDTYSYVVDKFWVVANTLDNGKLLIKTRRGKVHEVDCQDPMLRKASWWEKILYKSRFPRLESP